VSRSIGTPRRPVNQANPDRLSTRCETAYGAYWNAHGRGVRKMHSHQPAIQNYAAVISNAPSVLSNPDQRANR